MFRPALLGLVLVDLPVAIVVLVTGALYGFRDVAMAYFEWRSSHPWTFVLSLGLVVAFVAYRRKRRES